MDYFQIKKHSRWIFICCRRSYALKEGKSVVVTGKMTEGKVTPGTAAICLDSEGKPAFHCVIKGIEQGTQLMKMASADMKGTYGLITALN